MCVDMRKTAEALIVPAKLERFLALLSLAALRCALSLSAPLSKPVGSVMHDHRPLNLLSAVVPAEI